MWSSRGSLYVSARMPTLRCPILSFDVCPYTDEQCQLGISKRKCFGSGANIRIALLDYNSTFDVS